MMRQPRPAEPYATIKERVYCFETAYWDAHPWMVDFVRPYVPGDLHPNHVPEEVNAVRVTKVKRTEWERTFYQLEEVVWGQDVQIPDGPVLTTVRFSELTENQEGDPDV